MHDGKPPEGGKIDSYLFQVRMIREIVEFRRDWKRRSRSWGEQVIPEMLTEREWMDRFLVFMREARRG